MTTTKKKQNPKQKRIMVASVLIAATIALGGTFAWLTSKDSVTNRLTASADYGVSIVEDFTPPEDWVPGQAVNKDVGAVNTGNVSAMVKLTLSNYLTVSYEEATVRAFGNEGVEYVKLSATESENAVLAAQAGGYLVAAYDSNGNKISDVTLGKVGTKYNVYESGTATNQAPKAGYYIYRSDDSVMKNSWDYDGFYYDGTDYYKIDVDCNTQPTYGGGDTVTDDNNNGIADNGDFDVYFVTKSTYSGQPTLSEYDSTQNSIKATYTNGGGKSIYIYINLNENIVSTDAGDYWTYGGLDSSSKKAYFYLNKLLEPGTTSSDLVDSIELSSETQNGAYVDLTYDLNIDLDSVQAVYTQTSDGKTTIDTEKSALAAQGVLLASANIGSGEYAFDTATVTAGTSDADGNIESGTVTWSK